MKQIIDKSTRRSAPNTRENILDLVIVPETSTLITAVSVVVSHHLSDNDLVVCDLKLGPEKASPPTRLDRNIKAVNRAEYVRLLRASSLFTNPATTADEFADQI